jgi:Flp pilus assembly pilin Flp
MRSTLLKIRSRLQDLILQEEGQDLVEYALVIMMIATAAVVSVGKFSTGIVNYIQYVISHFP